MHVLVIYASNSGNTRSAAQTIADVLRRKKLDVTLQSVGDTAPKDLAGADVVIWGSCTWLTDGQQGQLQKQFADFAAGLRAENARFPDKPFGVFALGRHEYTHFCGAADLLEELVRDVGGRLVADSLRVDGFYQHNIETIAAWAECLTALPAVEKPRPARI